jgi:hypothetical protein
MTANIVWIVGSLIFVLWGTWNAVKNRDYGWAVAAILNLIMLILRLVLVLVYQLGLYSF